MENIGPWVLLASGVALLAAAIAVFVRGSAQTAVLGLFLLFGTALSGTGVFGLKFLPEFASFVKAADIMKSITANPSPETYTEAIKEIGSGEIKGAESELVATRLVANPVPGLDQLLSAGARQAKDQVGARVLRDAHQVFERKAQAASDLTEALARNGSLTTTQVNRYDAGTRTLIASRVAMSHVRPLPGPSLSETEAAKIMRAGGLTRQ